MRSVAVFGSSEARENDPLYEAARELGRLLARRGLRVVTGGYGGVMEAACRGAREAGGEALGVLAAIFTTRRPNPYLSDAVETPDLFERTRVLVEVSDAYVVLGGKSGTLAELAWVWALHRAGSLDSRPVILLGAVWEAILGSLVTSGVVGGAELGITRFVRVPEEVVPALEALAPRSED